MINFIKKVFSVKAFQNIAIYGTGQLMTGLINFLLVPIYSHFILPAEYGVLSLILMFLAVSGVIIDSGMTTAFSIRFYKVAEEEKDNMIFNIFFYYILFLLLIFFVFFIKRDLLSIIIQEEVSFEIQLRVVIILLLTVFVDFSFNLLILTQKSKIYLFVSVFRALLLGGFNILFLTIFKQNYDAYFNSLIISLGIVFVIIVIFYIKTFDFSKIVLKLNLLKQLLKIGLPLIPNGIFMFIITSGDRYLLNILGSTSLVGLYSVGYKFGNLIDQFFTIPFGKAFSPIIYKTYAKDVEEYKAKVADISFLYTIVGLIVIGGLFTFVDTFFTLFISEEYWDGFVIIPIVAMSLFIWGFSQFFSTSIVVKEKTYLSSFIAGLSAILNIGFNFLLIPDYGIWGAAAATLISYVIVFIVIYIVSRRLIHLKFNWIKGGINFLVFAGFAAFQIYFNNLGEFNALVLAVKSLVFLAFIVLMWFMNKNVVKKYVKIG